MNENLDLEKKVQEIFSYEKTSINKIRTRTKIKMLLEMSGIYMFLDKAALGIYFMPIRKPFIKISEKIRNYNKTEIAKKENLDKKYF